MVILMHHNMSAIPIVIIVISATFSAENGKKFIRNSLKNNMGDNSRKPLFLRAFGCFRFFVCEMQEI